MNTATQKNFISSAVFSIISLGIGFWFSQYDAVIARVQSGLFIITSILFAVVLIGTALLSPFIKKKYGSKAMPLHKSQWQSLILVAALLIIAINLAITNSNRTIIVTVTFACLIYSLICEFDVLISLAVVAKTHLINKNTGMLINPPEE